MTLAMRIGFLLAAFVALASVAAAQAPLPSAPDVSVDGVSSGVDTEASPDDTRGGVTAANDRAATGASTGVSGRDHSATEAGVASEEASTKVSADGGASRPEDASSGDFWSWLSLHLAAVVESVAGVLGLGTDAPEAADASAEGSASDDGLGLDGALVAPRTALAPDATGLIPLDGRTDELSGEARSLVPG
jgi:hypothetical protein